MGEGERSLNSLETKEDSKMEDETDIDLFNENTLDSNVVIDFDNSGKEGNNNKDYLIHCFKIIIMNIKQNKKDFVDNRLFGNIITLLG